MEMVYSVRIRDHLSRIMMILGQMHLMTQPMIQDMTQKLMMIDSVSATIQLSVGRKSQKPNWILYTCDIFEDNFLRKLFFPFGILYNYCTLLY